MSAIERSPYAEEKLQSLEKLALCRESQLTTLLSIFGERSHLSFPSIFIYGHTGTGKTYILQTALSTLELPHTFVNCVECFTARLLFEEILSQLYNHCPGPDNDFSSYERCDTFNEFVRYYERAISSQGLEKETVYIVLDKADILREMDANLLPGFLRLQELTGSNVTVIFLTEIAWETFRPNTGCLEPLTIYFTDYGKAELQKILSSDYPEEYSPEFYASFINILLGVFYAVCRDIKELRHLAALNFPKFCEPVVKGEAKETDTHKLFRNIEPHLKRAMQTVYLREISSSQWERIQQEDGEASQLKGLSAHAHVELPFYSKFLLIAGYLASYNPARTDKRFFVKHHGKIKKTDFLKKHEKTSNHLLGPKPFPLDRLLAILYSIVDSRVAPTANIFSQISSLVTLQLLTLVGHDDQLDAPKYKCTVSLDFIRAVARTVNFDIVRYLYDFL
ncbi:origin recognition complex subunit 5 [Hyla sarda]|uniref:origin recognition complex subunit 5 n=1 Tax=Hyla sarda TaxID=327740 RepID=UPI0024C405B4|nr:origin recognition complex subunit 5 [Hyla sarda]XP_056378072.1 origin recognition complex subunit 5 [Hyla sarda]XP_056378073.1 origin recognition complex subunit 5 [Hyla sarda]XP_056378074.1 origin recognition complex subunit 5 [Hyla sarda]